MHLQKAINLFLGEYKPVTRKGFGQCLTAFANLIGPQRPMEMIGSEHVLEYMQWLDQRDPAPGYYNNQLKTLRTFFNRCVKLGWIVRSPAAGVRYRPRPRAVDRAKAMPDRLYEELIDFTRACIRIKPQRMRGMRGLALVLFLGDTGCRRGGAAGLQWSDIDFTDRRATVTEKGKPPRAVFFGHECAAALKQWRLHQQPDKGNYVFGYRGSRLANENVGLFFRRLCIDAGIGSWGPHSLRHRKAYQLNDNRVSPSVGAALIGDTIEVYLNYYSPQDEGRIKQAADEHAYKGPSVASKIRKFGTK